MFITFEGPEGSGKTTQAKLLSKLLDEEKIDHILTKEPGTIFSKECQAIRSLLLDPSNKLDPRAELFLYLADRAQHVGNCIRPAIKEGKWVISDRFSFSTYAYQGFGRGHLHMGENDWFNETLTIAADQLQPDIAFIMDLPVEIGLVRAKRSNAEFEGGDRMEREEIEFHKKLREGFLDIAGNPHNKNRCVVLNAEKSIEELYEDVKEVLRQRTNGNKITF